MDLSANATQSKFQEITIAPMHTAEHLLNATMVKMFGCPRSKNAHIERKKSKCDYLLDSCPSNELVREIEDRMNETIARHLPVIAEIIPRTEAEKFLDLSKLPENTGEMLRIIRIGDYDVCACIGLHVENTSEIGIFKIISHDYNNEQGVWRLRFKLLK